jgi:hypothetical protein
LPPEVLAGQFFSSDQHVFNFQPYNLASAESVRGQKDFPQKLLSPGIRLTRSKKSFIFSVRRRQDKIIRSPINLNSPIAIIIFIRLANFVYPPSDLKLI